MRIVEVRRVLDYFVVLVNQKEDIRALKKHKYKMFSDYGSLGKEFVFLAPKIKTQTEARGYAVNLLKRLKNKNEYR